MVVAHHVADDLRALAVLGVGGEVLLPHRVEDAALHRLQAVADVGQRARGDDRQRVVEVAGLRRSGGGCGVAAGGGGVRRAGDIGLDSGGGLVGVFGCGKRRGDGGWRRGRYRYAETEKGDGGNGELGACFGLFAAFNVGLTSPVDAIVRDTTLKLISSRPAVASFSCVSTWHSWTFTFPRRRPSARRSPGSRRRCRCKNLASAGPSDERDRPLRRMQALPLELIFRHSA